MLRSALLILLCGLLVWLPAFSQEVAEGDDPASEAATEELFSASQEEFRAQMLLFLYEMNDALGLAMQHPLVGEQLAAHLGPGSVGVPLSEDTYAFVKDATWEELENMRGGVLPGSRAVCRPVDAVRDHRQTPGDPGFRAGRRERLRG